MSQGDASSDDVDLVRRRLLAAGGRYVAPAVLCTLLLGDRAWAQTSCPPAACAPGDPICPPTTNCTPYRSQGGGGGG